MKDEILKKAISDYFANATFKLMPSTEDSSLEVEIEPEAPEMDEAPKSLPEKMMKGMK
jgi:hypothetical protein